MFRVGVMNGWREMYPNPYPGIPYPYPDRYQAPMPIPSCSWELETDDRQISANQGRYENSGSLTG